MQNNALVRVQLPALSALFGFTLKLKSQKSRLTSHGWNWNEQAHSGVAHKRELSRLTFPAAENVAHCTNGKCLVAHRPYGTGSQWAREPSASYSIASELRPVPRCNVANASVLLTDAEHAYSSQTRLCFLQKAPMHALHRLLHCVGRISRKVSLRDETTGADQAKTLPRFTTRLNQWRVQIFDSRH
ncbi:hypothetical protein EI94DRAFT_1743693 [Lactarius quietus]|nr:hypothetical protein EI94DRAFT_1743693 [Lactarius quietus]